MALEVESARQKAARFLALAMEVRQKGNLELAELLTDAASAAFDKAETEQAESATHPASTAEPQQPAAQQQQQLQPDKKPDDRES
jgi:hypothetical protein